MTDLAHRSMGFAPREDPAPPPWIPVCRIDALTPDRGVAALVDGEQVAIFLLSPLVPNVQLIASGTASLADLLLDVHAGDRLLVLTFRPYARLAGEVIEFFRQAGGTIILISDDALAATS